MGAKMLAPGGAQAAPAGGPAPVNPMTAGLIGQAEQPPTPVPSPMRGAPTGVPIPTRNPAFSNPAGDANGARLIAEQPGMRSLMAETMSKPVGGRGDSVLPGGEGGDSSGSFASKPWKRGETVFGQNITGQNWKPTNGQVDLPMPSDSGPVQAKTLGAQPLPERNPAFHDAPKPAGLFTEQQFDTTAPAKPKMMGLFDGLLENPIGKAQKFGKGVPTNPLAQVGLGLLSSGYDGSNPYTNIQNALGRIPQTEIAMKSAEIAAAQAARTAKKDEQEDSDAQLRQLIAEMMLMSGMNPELGAGGKAPLKSAEGQARVIR